MDVKQKIMGPDVARRLLLGWLLGTTAAYGALTEGERDLGGLEGLARVSLLRVILIAVCTAGALQWLGRYRDTARRERWAILAVYTVYAGMALDSSFSWGLLGGCLLLFVCLLVYGLRGWEDAPEPAGQRRAAAGWRWLTALLTAAFFLFTACWGIGRVYTFSAPTYDMGIFSQMFYYMKQTGLPLTTLERDGLLSHFAVHVSPIYYLMLPFYCLAPRPETLAALQAAVLASAVVPLWMLGRRHGLTGAQRTLCCAALLLYPAFSGGTGYDLHENCFLTALILWLFYGLDTGRRGLTVLSALLTLAVKEDAAVYVAVVGLWRLLTGAVADTAKRRRCLADGAALLGGALACFFLVTGYLDRQGQGVMTYRYENFIYDDSESLLTVVKAVLMNPMKAVSESLEWEKLPFLAMTLGPLLGLPLLTRRYTRYVLLIPYILVNLMSDYQYQHNIFFQYTFGSTAFLMYLTVVNLADLRGDLRRVLVLAAVCCLSAVCFGKMVVPEAAPYPTQAARYHDHYQRLWQTLEQVPEQAGAAATTFYTTPLSGRRELYDIRYGTAAHLLQAEYVVMNPTAEKDFQAYASRAGGDGYENLTVLLEQSGYTLWQEVPGYLTIYRREGA